MVPDEAGFRRLVERVRGFHITDRAMLAAQRSAEAALAGGTADAEAFRAYAEAVRRYFAPFEREARAHLRDVDKRLEHANQVVFNLTAERAVAVKRIDATAGVLADLEPIAGIRS